MRVQHGVPSKDSDLLEMSSTYSEAVNRSTLFEGTAARALAEALADARNRFKAACDEARFHDMLKVAARKEIKKELVAALKRVIHYIEAMASDDDLKELQKAGVLLAKSRKRKKSKSDQAEVELAPAGA